MDCLAKGSCVIAKRDQKNALSIHTILNSGAYKILIYYEGAGEEELMKILGGKVAFGLHFSFNPMVEKEDRMNCQAGVLPRDLDEAGISFEETTRFADVVLLDLSAKSQKTRFTVSTNSVFRAITTNAGGISVKITLLNSKGPIATSDNTDKSSFLSAEIGPDTYTLDFSSDYNIINEAEERFCETFFIEIGISKKSDVENLIKLTDQCNDNNQLNSIFENLNKKVEEDGRFDYSPGHEFYLTNSKKLIVYEKDFDIPSLSFAYFEIFSDFVISDLAVAIYHENKEVLSSFDCTYVQGALDKGRFRFVIKQRSEPVKTIESTKKCTAFNLRIQVIKTTDKAFNSWKCHDHLAYLLPPTLNTFDKLWPKGTPQSSLPITTLFSNTLLAPNTKKDIYDKTSLIVQTKSIVKIVVESEESPMKLELLQGDKVIANDESSKETFPYVFTISAVIEADIEYIVKIGYLAKDNKKCHMYTLDLEVYPELEKGEKCKKVDIDSSCIFERNLDSDEFGYSGGEGFAPEEPFFVYLRSSEQYTYSLPLDLKYESVVTGHIISNNFGLTMELYKDNTLQEWGEFSATHRYQLVPTPLNKGQYTLVFKDLFLSKKKECIKVQLSLLIEDVSLSENVQFMMRKTETCSYPDQPGSLNTVGQLEDGNLHWHKLLSMVGSSTFIEFVLNEKSLVRVFIEPIDYAKININVLDSDLQIVASAPVMNFNDGLHRVFDSGQYFLSIEHSFTVSVRKNCPSFEMDLEISTLKIYNELAEMYDCKLSTPVTQIESFENVCIIYDSASLDYSVPFKLDTDSEVLITISYLNTLSGYLTLIVSDSENENLAKSQGIENISELKASLPAGDYEMRVLSSQGTDTTHPCWPLMLSLEIKTPQSTCKAGKVPSHLITKYGGPQNSDGSITYTGTFKINSYPDVIAVDAPTNCFGRVVAISHDPSVFIEIGIYTDSGLENFARLSYNSLDNSGVFWELKQRIEPYYIVISYVTQKIEDCLLFDLTLVIEPVRAVENIVECKLQSHEDLLPPRSLAFDKSANVGGDNYAVFDKWIVDKSADLPSGILSKPGKASQFIYEVSLDIKTQGIFSAEVVYDLLTSDYSLHLLQESQELAKSSWETVNEDELGDMLNFASIISGIILSPGQYKILLKQSLSANRIIQKFSDTSICFPFAFEIEFIPKTSSSKNQLILVEPDHLTHHNPSENLFIRLTFSEQTGPIDVVLTQISNSQDINPASVKVLEPGNKVKAKFLNSDLKPGECYELKIKTQDILNDNLKHSFCMLNCNCNPKANPICTSVLSCICKEPYYGLLCYDCISGYYPKGGQCVEVVEVSPEITSMSFNVKSPVKQSDVIKLNAYFSSHPYNALGLKIPIIKGPNAISSALVLRSGGVEVQAITVIPIGKDGVQWALEFDNADFVPENMYTVFYKKDIVFDENNKVFEYQGPLPGISMSKPEKPCVNGVWKGEKCLCSEGYTGSSCEMCIEGYELKDKKCILVQNNQNSQGDSVDYGAYIMYCEPKDTIILKEPEDFDVTIQLSMPAFTSEGLIIDQLTNTKYMIKAYALQRPNTKKLVYPTSAFTSDSIYWTLTFNKKSFENNAEYKFVQIKDVLYSKSGKPFHKPQVPLVKLITSYGNSCSSHGTFDEVCICDRGYTGSQCEKCSEGYVLLNQSCKLLEDSAEMSTKDIVLYCFGYMFIGVLVLYMITLLRKKKPSEHEGFEMLPREESGEDIDLYSR